MKYRPCGVAMKRTLTAALIFSSMLSVPSSAQTGAAPQAPQSPPVETRAEPSPVDDFAHQVESLKKSLEGFNSGIEERAKTIGQLIDPGKLKSEMENLRGFVASALGSVSDDSKVAELGVQALKHAQSKLEQIAKDTRFTKDQKDFLLNEWNRIVADSTTAADDLDKARREFVQLLKVLQTREDFVDELLQVQKAREAVEIIRQISNDIRTASDSLRGVIRSLKPPGS